MPVPAGPMPKTMVLRVDRVDVALLPQRLGPDRAPAAGDDVHRQHVGGPLDRLRAQHLDRALDGVAVERLAGVDDVEQLVDEPLDERDVGARAGHAELVAAHVDLDVRELALHGAEHLVAWPEQGHHGDLGRHDDGVLADVGMGLPGRRVSGSGPVGMGVSHRGHILRARTDRGRQSRAGSAGGPGERPPAEDVEVGVEDGLSGSGARVEHHPVPVGQPFPFGDLPRDRHDLGEVLG